MRTSIQLQMTPPHLHSPPLPPASPSLNQDSQKLLCAQRAAALVKPNTLLGLGTGSTASLFLQQLSHLLSINSLHSIVGVPTSIKTDTLAKELNIPLTNLGSDPIDLSVDGADEVDEELNLVKGRGGSLLREKMVEGASKEFVVIVDESKLVPRLGTTGPVPVEVVKFGWEYTVMRIKEVFGGGEMGFDAKLRTVWDEKEGKEVPFMTDNGNYIVNLLFEKGIHGDLGTFSDKILRIPGVMEHGVFIGMATSVIVAKKDGSIMILNKK